MKQLLICTARIIIITNVYWWRQNNGVLQYRGSTGMKPGNKIFAQVEFFSQFRHVEFFIRYQADTTVTGCERLVQLQVRQCHVCTHVFAHTQKHLKQCM